MPLFATYAPIPQVGLTRMPEFGYELDLSVASAALVPLIKEWLDAAVRDMVLQVGGPGPEQTLQCATQSFMQLG